MYITQLEATLSAYILIPPTHNARMTEMRTSVVGVPLAHLIYGPKIVRYDTLLNICK